MTEEVIMPFKPTDLIVPLAMAAIAGVGWFWRRHITGQRHSERTAALREAAELHKLLVEQGLSFQDARDIRNALNRGELPLMPQVQRAVIEADMQPEDSQSLGDGAMNEQHSGPLQFQDTTYGMRVALANELQKIDLDIDLLIQELQFDATPLRCDTLRSAQEAWLEYRLREYKAAAAEWEGGTGAPVIGTARMIQLSEQRRDDLRSMKERQARQ